MHAKYQCSIFDTSEDMRQVKVFVTDRGTDGQTDEWVLMSPANAKGGGQQVAPLRYAYDIHVYDAFSRIVILYQDSQISEIKVARLHI